MTEAVARDLERANPVTEHTVHRLTGLDAREVLLRELVSDETAAHGPWAARARSGRRRSVAAPLLAAAAVAVVVLSAVSLLDDRLDRGEAPVAGPAPLASSCPGVSLPGTAQVVQSRAEGTYCVHVPTDDTSEVSAGRTAPTAWSALTVGDGSPDVMATVFVAAVPSRPVDGVLVLGVTSDAFPDDVVDADGRVLPTHRVFGTASSDVTAVEIVLPDGSTVAAGLREGVWGAWWPADAGGPDESQVRISTSGAATTTVGIDAVGLPEASRVMDGVPEPFLQSGT